MLFGLVTFAWLGRAFQTTTDKRSSKFQKNISEDARQKEDVHNAFTSGLTAGDCRINRYIHDNPPDTYCLIVRGMQETLILASNGPINYPGKRPGNKTVRRTSRKRPSSSPTTTSALPRTSTLSLLSGRRLETAPAPPRICRVDPQRNPTLLQLPSRNLHLPHAM